MNGHDGMMANGNKILEWYFVDALDQFAILKVL
jgi:hypothetical protein